MTGHTDRPDWRAATAGDWALIANATSDVSLRHTELVEELGRLLDVLAGALRTEPFGTAPAGGVGEQLVRLNLVGDGALQRGLELLGRALPDAPGQPRGTRRHGRSGERVLALLAEIAAGYARALQERTLTTQEVISRALLQAKDEVERVLRVSEERFREVFTASAVGIMISGLDGVVVEHNAAFRDMLGYPDEDLAGRGVFELFDPDTVAAVRACYQDVLGGGIRRARRPAQLIGKDGEIVWTLLSISLLRDSDGQPAHYLTMVDNVSDLYLLAENVTRQGLYDVLTALPNRQFLANRLAELAGRPDPPVRITLCHIDLDRLKLINNGLGWAAGDLMLRTVAGRLRQSLADRNAILARIGGDEFAVLITHDGGDADGDPDVLDLIRAINQALEEPVYIDEQGMAVSASIGIVRRLSSEVSAEELLREAETTVHRLKFRDKVQWGMFDERQDARDRANSRLAAEMPAAMNTGEIEPLFQPLVRLTDGSVPAVEARVEWPHAELGIQDHDQCVALAEQTSLALHLGGWLLEVACRQASEWAGELGQEAPTMVVNLTARQANDPDLISALTRIVSDSGIEPERLRIGMPAAEVCRPDSDAEDNIRVLGELGMPTILHDFHADHLSVVDSCPPVRGLVLADSVLARLGPEPDRNALSALSLAHLVPLAQSRGLTVVIPGVTTRQQADWLREIGVDVAQGPHFGRAFSPRTRAHR